MSGDLFYDRASLVSIGGRAEAIGTAVSTSAVGIRDGITAAVEAHPSLAAGQALGVALSRWSEKMVQLGAQVGTVRARLDETVAHYDQTEQVNTANHDNLFR